MRRTKKQPPPGAYIGKETAFTHAVIDLLLNVGLWAMRANSGGMAVEDKSSGRRRFIRFAEAGTADVLAILPPHGRLWAIETKVHPNKPTQDQEQFLERIRELGGIGTLAYGMIDVVRVLVEHDVIDDQQAYMLGYEPREVTE